MTPEKDPLTGKFVAVGTGAGQAAQQIDWASVQVPDDLPIEVKVDGKVEKVSFAEARKGYTRQAYMTKRLQEISDAERQVAAREQAVADKEAMLRVRLQPGLGTAQPGGTDVTGYGVWPETQGGFGGLSEHPIGGTPNPQVASLPQFDDDDETVSAKHLRALQAQIARIANTQAGMYQQMERRLRQSEIHALEDDAEATMIQQYEDYDPGEYQDVLLRLAPHERQYLANLDPVTRRKMVYHEYMKKAASTGGPEEEATTPFSEGERSGGASVVQAPKPLGPDDYRDREKLGDFMSAYRQSKKLPLTELDARKG